MPIVPQCLACGTCCFSKLKNYVRVTGDDHARLGERADELALFDGHRAFMRMVDGHCGALRVNGATGLLHCDAYETRPDVCRNLARSSTACLGEIEAKSARPLVALRRARDVLASLTLAVIEPLIGPVLEPVLAKEPREG